MRKMKDSGIEWIGKLPVGWGICRLKNYAKICNGISHKKITDDSGQYPIMGSGGEFLRASEYLYNQPSVLLGRKGTIDKPLYVDFPFWTVDTMYYTKINPKCVIRYFFYLCLTINFDYYQYGSAVPSMTQRDLNNISFQLPSYLEQQQIADYLDKKCASIDSIIEKQRLVIDKLKAYKQSVITEAVTKGLTPNVPMKDSGIEWIGKIPKRWETSKISNEFINLDAKRKPISSENRGSIEGTYDYYGASGVIDKIDNYIFDETLILIGEDGANLVMRNLPIIYIAKGKYWVNNHAHVLKPVRNNLYFMAYQLECVDLLNYITGSAQPKLTQANLLIIPIVCPPFSEQQQIVDYLDKKCVEIDKLITAKESIIDKLTAYKQSLIYEAVTGKMEI